MTIEKPLRKERRRATGFEWTIENDEQTNRFRFTPFDKIKNKIPSVDTRNISRHRQEIADRTGTFRRRSVFMVVVAAVIVLRSVVRMRRQMPAMRFERTRYQTMDRVPEQERRDRQDDHEKEDPFIVDAGTHCHAYRKKIPVYFIQNNP